MGSFAQPEGEPWVTSLLVSLMEEGWALKNCREGVVGGLAPSC